MPDGGSLGINVVRGYRQADGYERVGVAEIRAAPIAAVPHDEGNVGIGGVYRDHQLPTRAVIAPVTGNQAAEFGEAKVNVGIRGTSEVAAVPFGPSVAAFSPLRRNHILAARTGGHHRDVRVAAVGNFIPAFSRHQFGFGPVVRSFQALKSYRGVEILVAWQRDVVELEFVLGSPNVGPSTNDGDHGSFDRGGAFDRRFPDVHILEFRAVAQRDSDHGRPGHQS